ncbi:MAG: hypothetical protein AAB019_04835 [Planctomycetota bacterium]
MRKKSKMAGLVSRALLVLGVSILIVSFFAPWAYGQGLLGLASKTIYPYQDSSFRLVLGLLIIIIGAIFFSMLARFYSSFIIFLSGTGILFLGFYLWREIEASDLHFLGLAPLKLAEAHPDVGIFLLIGAGIFLILSAVLSVLGKQKW